MGRASQRKWQKRVLASKIYENKSENRFRKLGFSVFVVLAGSVVFGLYGWYLSLNRSAGNTDGGNMYALIETNHGNIKIELFPDKAPRTVDNFVKLAKEGYYDGLIFHRVIKDFVIQTGQNESRPADMVEEDINDLKNERGMLSFAKASPGGKLSTQFDSQFFINLKHNAMLDEAGNRFYPFAKVVEGMDVVDEISMVKASGPPEDKPLTDVVMTKVTITDK